MNIERVGVREMGEEREREGGEERESTEAITKKER